MTTNPIAGKTLLITGGTGSFGRRLVETVLAHHQPKKVIVFSRDELRQYEMANLPQLAPHARRLRFFRGNVRGAVRLQRASELKTLVQQEIPWAD
jgi:UDP-N-acetylglucosamine 4,6-dehydratase